MLTPNSKLIIEKANILHSRILWEWRNDDKTRSLSRYSEIISWNEHEKWLKDTLEDPYKYIYVGIPKDSTKKKPIGVLRFDLIDSEKNYYETSINIAPSFRGKGYGLKLLSSGIDLFAKEISCKIKIFAEIKQSNHISSKLFTSVGFLSCDSRREGFSLYTLKI